jgi:lipoprotein-anchoring transpeptidase ErfK/SrfK
MRGRRRLLIGASLAAGVATVLVVCLAIGGSLAPADRQHAFNQVILASSASDVGAVAWTAPGASGSGEVTWTVPQAPSLTATSSSTTSSTTSPSSTTSTTQTSSTAAVVKKEILVAKLPWTGAPGSRKPGGPRRMWVPGHWLHAPSILPVIGVQSGWYHVRLAQRPNGSTAWVRSKYIKSLATDPYHVIIDLSSTHLHLYKEGRQIGNYPVGVGLPAYPTPRGHFFMALFAKAPSSAWGAYVIITSAHSNTITDWDNTGDGITGIHGPLGADAQIGTTGARVSHGCIRMHKRHLLHLRVPVGTPVDIRL